MNASEKKQWCSSGRWMTILNIVIWNNNLMELQPPNKKFTCSNNHVLPAFQKLDRFLVTTNWLNHYHGHMSMQVVAF